MKVKTNSVYVHRDTNRPMKVIAPRGFVCEAREPKGRTKLVPTSKLRRSNTVDLGLFRSLD